jgi:hypothetical protein
MNNDHYIAMMDEKLFSFMEIHGATHFLQEGVSCYTSKKMMTFLRE